MMLPVLGDKSFSGERKKDENRARAAISSGVVAELQGQTDKEDLFHSKAKLFLSRTHLPPAVFHTKPLSLRAQLQSNVGRTQAAEWHQPVLPLSSARQGDLTATVEKSFKPLRAA